MISGNVIEHSSAIKTFEIPGVKGESHHLHTNKFLQRAYKEGGYKDALLRRLKFNRLTGLEAELIVSDISQLFGESPKIDIKSDDYLMMEADLVRTMISEWQRNIDSAEVALKDEITDIADRADEGFDKYVLMFLETYFITKFVGSEKVAKASQDNINFAWKAGKQEISNQIGKDFTKFGLTDRHGIQWLNADTRFWLRHRWDSLVSKQVSDMVNRTIGDLGIEHSQFPSVISENFASIARQHSFYWEIVGATAISRARTWASLIAMDDAGITRCRWYTTFDERTCEVCPELDGNVYDVADCIDAMLSTWDFNNPILALNTSPWIYYSKTQDKYFYTLRDEDGKVISKTYFDKEKLKDVNWLISHGLIYPPIHNDCRCMLLPEIQGTV
jgi:hypothetical protein